MCVSACTARTAFSSPSRRTTIEIVNSFDPCAIAMKRVPAHAQQRRR
jgi:hypothetical protein